MIEDVNLSLKSKKSEDLIDNKIKSWLGIR